MSCAACAAPLTGNNPACGACFGPHYCGDDCAAAHAEAHAADCARVSEAIDAASYCDDAACARCGAPAPATSCPACAAAAWCGPLCLAADRRAHEAACRDMCAAKFEALFFAASAGHEDAAYNVAVAYESGLFNVTPDAREAAAWFAAAAGAGSARAAFQLGVYAKTGRGAPADDAEAFAWFARAAEGGHVMARYNAGVALENGAGAPRDLAAAAECFAFVAQNSDDATLARLAARRLAACTGGGSPASARSPAGGAGFAGGGGGGGGGGARAPRR